MVKFRVQASEFNKAIDVLSIVSPKSVASQGGAGFLFVIRANGSCQAYSQDKQHCAMAELPVSGVEGEGAFVYPAEYVASFRHLGDTEINFEAGDNDGNYYVRYETSSGGSGERPTIDPEKLRAVQIPEAKDEDPSIPAALLRKGLDTVKGALAKEGDTKVDEFYQGLQIFDASKPEWAPGDGYLFAADGIRAAYFYCEAFKGKGLVIHGQHLSHLLNFLSKCEGEVSIRSTDNWSFMVNQGRVLGWVHHAKTHPRFKYYGEDMEKHVLIMDQDFLLRTLRYMKAELPSKADKIRVTYEASSDAWALRFQFKETTGQATSPLVYVTPDSDTSKTTGFAFNASINHLIELFESMEAKRVALRVAIFPPKGNRRESALFRTIDRFWLDSSGKVQPGPEKGIECRVTRFAPSKD